LTSPCIAEHEELEGAWRERDRESEGKRRGKKKEDEKPYTNSDTKPILTEI